MNKETVRSNFQRFSASLFVDKCRYQKHYKSWDTTTWTVPLMLTDVRLDEILENKTVDRIRIYVDDHELLRKLFPGRGLDTILLELDVT